MSTFALTVYAYALQIPEGKVTTYKQLAIAAGSPNASRAVGTALSTNPYAPTVPCHRVINAQGMLSGFFGKTEGESIREKLKLLEAEGVSGWKNDKLPKALMSKHLFVDFQPLNYKVTKESLTKAVEAARTSQE